MQVIPPGDREQGAFRVPAGRDASALLDAVLADAPAARALLDPELRVVRANARFAALGGLEGAAAIGRTLREVLGERAAALEAAAQSVLETGEPMADLELRGLGQPGAGEAPAYRAGLSLVRAEGGRLLGVSVVVEDLTAERAARAALARSEERYRSLAEATGDIVWTTDAAGAFVEPQPAWEAYTGQP